MKELLEQWSRLEPERCWRGSTNDIDCGFEYFIKSQVFVYGVGEDMGGSWMRIQAAVQEAIEARGWYWKIECGYSGDLSVPLFYAQVENSSRETYRQEGYTTAAEALLRAYLSALERIRNE